MPALYIVLQEKIPGVEAIGLEGRALSRHSDRMEELARQAGVRSLSYFFSVPKDEAIALLDGHETNDIPDEQWFSPEEGLKTISALSRALADARQQNADLIRELAEFEQVLAVARAKNVRWHLAIDY